MRKDSNIDCSLTEKKKVFKSGRITKFLKPLPVRRNLFCRLSKSEKGFGTPCICPFFKYRKNFSGLHEPGTRLSGLPPKAAVTAPIPANIGYRNENIFRIGHKIGIFRWNDKTPAVGLFSGILTYNFLHGCSYTESYSLYFNAPFAFCPIPYDVKSGNRSLITRVRT